MNLREARPSGRSGEQTKGLRTKERSEVVSTALPCEQVSEAKRRANRRFVNKRAKRCGEHGFAVQTSERSETESKPKVCERTMMKGKEGGRRCLFSNFDALNTAILGLKGGVG